MSKEKVDIIVEGGKATAGATMGKAFGPLKVNVQDILKLINEKTAAFKGIKVPVKVVVDTETKEFEVEVGSPPVSELIKKELGLEKGSGTPNKNKIANLSIEQVIKIALMKKDSMLDKSLKSAVKSVIGSCNSLGCLIESKTSKEVNKDIEQGKYNHLIEKKETETPSEKFKELQDYLKQFQERQRAIEATKAAEEAKKEAEKAAKKEVIKEEPKKEGAKEAAGKEEKKEVKEEAPKKEEKKEVKKK